MDSIKKIFNFSKEPENQKENTKMRQLIEDIVKAIVDDEGAVQVKEIEGESSSIIEILVDKDDLGKVIGKAGKNAQSIRNIIYAASFKTRKRYTVDINSRT